MELACDSAPISYPILFEQELLAFVDWIDYEGKSKPTDIQVHYSKGDLLRQTALDYLVRKNVRMKGAKAKIKPKGVLRIRRFSPPRSSPEDAKLDRYLGKP